MIYPNIIYHPDSDITVFIDTLQQIGNSASADVISYQSSLDGSLRSFNRGLGAREILLRGKISTDNVDTLRRQLNYLRGKQVYLMLGAQNTATVARIRSFDIPVAVGTYSPLTLDVVAESETEGQFHEAEDCSHSGATFEADEYASKGQRAVLNAQNEYVEFSLTQSDIILPEGDYIMFCRAYDVNQVTDDLSIQVLNNSDSTTVGSGTNTLTGSYTIYLLDVTVGSDDVGDVIDFRISKATATTNTIYIDFLGFVRA